MFFCLVQRIEIERQKDAEHQRNANGHIRIAGKIKIEPERVGEGADPCLVERRRRWSEGERDKWLDGVRHAGFLEQSDRKYHQSVPHQVRIGAFRLFLFELRNHVLVVKDRSGDQMRKIGDEQGVVGQPIARDLAAIGVHQKRDLGDAVKGNPDRKQNVHGQLGRDQCIQIGGKEAGIFEIAEHKQVAGHAGGQRRKTRPSSALPGSTEIRSHN